MRRYAVLSSRQVHKRATDLGFVFFVRENERPNAASQKEDLQPVAGQEAPQHRLSMPSGSSSSPPSSSGGSNSTRNVRWSIVGSCCNIVISCPSTGDMYMNSNIDGVTYSVSYHLYCSAIFCRTKAVDLTRYPEYTDTNLSKDDIYSGK